MAETIGTQLPGCVDNYYGGKMETIQQIPTGKKQCWKILLPVLVYGLSSTMLHCNIRRHSLFRSTLTGLKSGTAHIDASTLSIVFFFFLCFAAVRIAMAPKLS